MQYIIPLISCIVSFVFAVTVLDQYFARRKPYQLVWAIGLFMYTIGAGTEFWTGVWGIDLIAYQLWYLFGAILVAAYLGMGTLYLLTRRKTAHIIMAILLVASIYSAFRVFTANIDLTGMQTLTGGVMPADVRILTAILNTFGTVALVGGALYSAWIFWRRRILFNRMIANILIAFGAILPAIGGSNLTVGGSIRVFFIFELLGIIIIFIGFLRTKEVFGFFRFPLVHGFQKVARGN